MLNCIAERRPDVVGEKTWPKLCTLKQSKSVTGALPPDADDDAGELHPAVDGEPSVYVVGFVHVIQFAEWETDGCLMPATL